MKIYKSANEATNESCVYALGCFDGVHVAHAKVISEAVRVARTLGTKSGVWCFSEPPKNAFLKVPVPLLCDAEKKAELIAGLSVDVLICPDFDGEIRDISAENFVFDILKKNAGAVHIVTGKNYTFGKGGVGNTELLSRLCESAGIGLTVLDDVYYNGTKVSSSAVRDAVSIGDVATAELLLGRRFCLRVESRNDTLVVMEKLACPPDGVYSLDLCGDVTANNARVLVKNRTVVVDG